MERRTLLHSLLAIPAVAVTHKGQEVGKAYKIEPEARYEIFINARMIDLDTFCNTPSNFPTNTPVHTVHVSNEESLDDAIRIFKVSE